MPDPETMRNTIPQTCFSTTNINKFKSNYQQTLLIFFFPILIQFYSWKKHQPKLFPSSTQKQQRAWLRGYTKSAPLSAGLAVLFRSGQVPANCPANRSIAHEWRTPASQASVNPTRMDAIGSCCVCDCPALTAIIPFATTVCNVTVTTN